MNGGVGGKEPRRKQDGSSRDMWSRERFVRQGHAKGHSKLIEWSQAEGKRRKTTGHAGGWGDRRKKQDLNQRRNL